MTTVNRRAETITVADRWTYEWAARRRPFLHPVATPAGHVLTRDAPADHPWHHALWFAIKYVDEDNFWEEMEPYGVVRHDGEPDVVVGHDGTVTVAGSLTWTRPDRTTVALSEHRSFTHVPLGNDAYAIDLDTTLIPHTDVRLERSPFTTWGGYGGLTFRGRGDFVDTEILLDDGSRHPRVEGVPSRWLGLSGVVDNAPVGVAMFDHPANRRHPVPFYGSCQADNYGSDGWSNFFNAAFLFHEGMDLAGGEPLRVRHRVIIHDGAWDHDQLAAAWATWTGEGMVARQPVAHAKLVG